MFADSVHLRVSGGFPLQELEGESATLARVNVVVHVGNERTESSHEAGGQQGRGSPELLKRKQMKDEERSWKCWQN